MALMFFGIGQRLARFLISRRATDILGRESAEGFEQAGIDDPLDDRRNTPDLDRMLPTVAEAVEKFERFSASVFDEIEKRRFAGIERAITVAPIRVGQ